MTTIELTAKQRKAMAAFTPEKIAKLNPERVKRMQTVYETEQLQFKIIAGDRAVGVLNRGLFGPTVFYARLVSQRWVPCDKFGVAKT